MLEVTDSQILGRLLALDGEHLSPENARFVLALDFPAKDHSREVELAEKSNEGTLTDEEREEYAAYVRVGSIVDILKARALKAVHL